eukprot:3654759-Pyramimonas_sp.AAC.1
MIVAFYGTPVAWPTAQELPVESAEEAAERLKKKFGRAAAEHEGDEDTDDEDADSIDEGEEHDPHPAGGQKAAAPKQRA